MAIGPGKYDDLCTRVRKQTQARGGVLLIVVDGEQGSGFSAQLTMEQTLLIPQILRDVAERIERDGIAAAGGTTV